MSQNPNRKSSKPSSSTSSRARGATKKTKNISQSNTVSKYFKSEPKRLEDSSEDDFMSPIKLKKPAKVAWRLTKEPPKQKMGKKTSQKQSRLVLENFSSEDVNAEHLQMALALSKSEEEVKEDLPDIGAILQNAKATSLERFGFKGKKALEGENWRPRASQPSKKGKNRFKYVNPILNMRTEEDRDQLINSKISLILNQMGLVAKNRGNFELFSDRLHDFCCTDCLLFNFDCTKGKFYVPHLNLPERGFNSLLRDWGSIIGREKTPEPPKKPKKRSISPDLFGSDDEIDLQAQNSDLKIPETNLQAPEVQDVKLQYAEASTSKTNEEDDSILEESLIEANMASPQNAVDECIVLSEPLEAREANLNVTDYLTQLLSQNRYSFDDCLDISEESTVNNQKLNGSFAKSSESALNEDELNESAPLFQESTVIDETEESTLIYSLSSPGNREIIATPPKESIISSPKKVYSQESAFNDDQELNYSSNYCSQEVVLSDIEESSATLYSSTPPKKSNVKKSPIKDLDSSQESTLNDEELNYSVLYATESTVNCNQESILVDEELIYGLPSKGIQQPTLNNSSTPFLNQVSSNFKESTVSCSQSIFIDDDLNYSATPSKGIQQQQSTEPASISQEPTVNIPTPINSQYIIKTTNITPMLDYDAMTTPLIAKELDKIGVKPLKRVRGAKLLKYIYDSTHPLIEEGSPAKRARVEDLGGAIEIVGDKLLENEILIFERRQKAKVKTCKAPLQIVWHNFLCSNPEIRENILLYEPVQLESLHAMLKELGFMFHVQDLLTFLDRKCITVRVAQSQGKRHR